MGDQIGAGVAGTLSYVSNKEYSRVLRASITDIERAELFAALCRINVLYMIARAGSGHIGSSFSSMELMCWLYLNELNTASSGAHESVTPRFFSSKGHDAPAYYSVLIGLGRLDFEMLHRLRRLGGLPGHPDVGTPGMITNTGSLGMGISKAKGFITGQRLSGLKRKIYVLTGDGELQEGQLWESLISAANSALHELTVIVDHNKLQSDTLVSKVSDLGDIERKFAAFGWYVVRCNGNDVRSISKALDLTKAVLDRPQVIIADTVKGKGVSFMEHTAIDSDIEFYRFHSGAPSDESYARALNELVTSANSKLVALGEHELVLDSVIRPSVAPPENLSKMIDAYSKALIEWAMVNTSIVALDADLVLDTGLIPFQKQFRDRFIECGIAEQDMVSQAGAMALAGLLPIVHSFSCFLTSRPSEQIYNNCTEQTKVLYVGSLAGVLPGGPGHSHQAVRDIAAMSAMPGLVIIEPMCASQVPGALDWMMSVHSASAYLRLTSVPVPEREELKNLTALSEGCGHLVVDGREIAIVATNPILIVEALRAAEMLIQDIGHPVRVIGTPWLNRVDVDWYRGALSGIKHLITVESHYVEGGFGRMLTACLATGGVLGATRVHNWGIDRIPPSGTNAEVLRHFSLDAASIARKVILTLSAEPGRSPVST